MTFKKFEKILKTKYPEAAAHMHGTYGGTEGINGVEIFFTPDGKGYSYRGSYLQILDRLGIKVIYKSTLDMYEKTIEKLEAENGESNPFVPEEVIDNTAEIDRYKKLLAKIEEEQYIVV